MTRRLDRIGSWVFGLSAIGNAGFAVDALIRGSRWAFVLSTFGIVCALIAWGGCDYRERQSRAEQHARDGIL